MEVETRVKTVSTDVNRDDCLKIVMKKKVGRPCKIKRGRPKRITFPRLPKPPQLKFSSGCSVKGCTNPDKWMYSLPEAENLREQWLEFISRPDWTPDSSARVCEIHFGREMWKKSRDGYRTLLPDAIPTLTEPECGIEDSKSFNFVDVLNLEESEVFVNSELLEPEIDMSEEPYDSLLSLSTEQEAVLQAKSRKQQYLINIKQNPAKYSEYLQKERMRHKIRRKSLQTLPHSIEEEQFNEQSLDMHQELLERATEGSIDQFPSIKVEHLYTMEEEAIVPDLVFPSNNNMEIMENVNSDKSEDTSNNPLSSNLVLEKGYRCPICGKYLARKASLKYHLEKTHPHEKMAQWLVLDLTTRLKYKRKDDVLKEWYTMYPDMVSGTSIDPNTSVLSSDESMGGTNLIPVVSNWEAMPPTSTSENKDQKMKNCIVGKEQLESNTETRLSIDSQELVSNPQSSDQLPQTQLQIATTLSIQQLLQSRSEVYDPIETNNMFNIKVKDASSYMFCASLRSLTNEKRLVLKRKLMEVVNAVITHNLDPERIIIACVP